MALKRPGYVWMYQQPNRSAIEHAVTQSANQIASAKRIASAQAPTGARTKTVYKKLVYQIETTMNIGKWQIAWAYKAISVQARVNLCVGTTMGLDATKQHTTVCETATSELRRNHFQIENTVLVQSNGEKLFVTEHELRFYIVAGNTWGEARATLARLLTMFGGTSPNTNSNKIRLIMYDLKLK